jgi:hypothetical protein
MADVRDIVGTQALTPTRLNSAESANRRAPRLPPRDQDRRRKREQEEQARDDDHQLDEYV